MTLNAHWRRYLRMVFVDDPHIVGLNLRVQSIPWNNLHHEKRLIVLVEGKEWSDARQQIRDGYPIGSDESSRDTYTGKVRVCQNEFIAMSHFAEDF